MNSVRYEMFKFLNNKKIILLGFGKSNFEVAKVLDDLKIDFKICDINDDSYYFSRLKNFKNSKVKFSVGKDYLKNLESDIIFRSPGVPYICNDITEARSRGVHFTSEIELFIKFCPTKLIFGVTGSDGKTTVATIIYEMLKKSGKDVFIGGNIGFSLLSVIDEIRATSYVVLELSSFQLISATISPKIAIVTNISENHLDLHNSFQEYIDAKTNILINQNIDDIAVLNLNDKIVNKLSYKTVACKRFFSSNINLRVDNGCWIDKNKNIIFSKYSSDFEIMRSEDIKIPGIHNLENFMAAICACFDCVNITDIKYVAKNFFGVKHRLEFVKVVNNVRYYDDSIASTPNRTIKGALSVFQKNVILIAGGYDKNLNFRNLGKVICRKVKILILLGQTSEKIQKEVLNCKIKPKPKIFIVDSMEKAVNISSENGSNDDVVLLSPACASFGMYKNFEERGEDFKKHVNFLKSYDSTENVNRLSIVKRTQIDV